MKQYIFNAFFLVYFIVIFALHFGGCVSKKNTLIDKGTTEQAEAIKQVTESEETTEEIKNNIVTFEAGESLIIGSELVIFGDSGKYNTQTGEASGVKAVKKNTEEQKKQNTTKHNKTQQNTTKKSNINSCDSTSINIDKKNIIQEEEKEIKNYWYIWLVIGAVGAIVLIIAIRILLR